MRQLMNACPLPVGLENDLTPESEVADNFQTPCWKMTAGGRWHLLANVVKNLWRSVTTAGDDRVKPTIRAPEVVMRRLTLGRCISHSSEIFNDDRQGITVLHIEESHQSGHIA